eukprot:3028132-Rhodomonas_salina.1
MLLVPSPHVSLLLVAGLCVALCDVVFMPCAVCSVLCASCSVHCAVHYARRSGSCIADRALRVMQRHALCIAHCTLCFVLCASSIVHRAGAGRRTSVASPPRHEVLDPPHVPHHLQAQNALSCLLPRLGLFHHVMTTADLNHVILVT